MHQYLKPTIIILYYFVLLGISILLQSILLQCIEKRKSVLFTLFYISKAYYGTEEKTFETTYIHIIWYNQHYKNTPLGLHYNIIFNSIQYSAKFYSILYCISRIYYSKTFRIYKTIATHFSVRSRFKSRKWIPTQRC